MKLVRQWFIPSVLFVWSALGWASDGVPPSWSHQAEVTPKQIGLTVIAVPTDLLDHVSPTLQDLRLFNPSGQEVPYFLEQPSRSPARWVPLDSFESRLENKTTLLTGKAPAATVDRLRLESPAESFLKSVSLDVFEKGRWVTLWKGRPIFRTVLGSSNLEVEVPPRRLNQFRVRVDDGQTLPIPFVGMSARLAAEEAPPSIEKMKVEPSKREERALETYLTIPLPGKNMFVDGISIETKDPMFQRHARVVVRQLDPKALPEGGRQIVEGLLGETSLFRTKGENGLVSENLFIPVNNRIPTSEIQLAIMNGDAPPLKIQSITVHHIPPRLFFFASDLTPLRLAGGNPGAAAPRYDWPLTRALPVPGAVGKTKNNPDYVPPAVAPLLPSVGGSFDGKGWAYRSSVQVNRPGVQELEIPLPVLVHGSPDGKDLRLVRENRQIPFVYNRNGAYHALDPEFSPIPPSVKGVSRWEIKLPMSGIPISHVELQAGESLFQRPLRLIEERLTTNGERFERPLVQHTWRRSGDQKSLFLPLSSAPESDRLILAIENGDNAPLSLQSVHLYYRTFGLVFKTETNAPLWLYYGHPTARFPVYDADLAAQELLSADKNIAVAGTEEKIKRQWNWGSQGKASGLFWVVLTAVTLALLLVIKRLLPPPPTKP